MSTEKLKTQLNNLAEEVNKHLFEGCREWWWVGEQEGGICCFDDTDFISLEDMIYIIDNAITYDQYSEWRNAEIENINEHINLRSWMMGARHNMRQKSIEDLYAEAKKIRVLSEELLRMVNNSDKI